MKVEEILNWLNQNKYEFQYRGNDQINIIGFSSLNSCEPGKITWVKKRENYEKLNDHSQITVAVVQEGLDFEIPNQIISSNSKEIFFGILHHFWGSEKQSGFIGEGTYISSEAEIEPTVNIGYNCSIVGKVKIGANSVIENNVVIQGDVIIGENCIIHSGSVIGKDGFGYYYDRNNIPQKVEHYGGVIIGNRVEIGANSTVDRGTIDSTIIGDDTKIDNLTNIGHNVQIGAGVIVIGCTEIAGSVKIGDKSYIAPQACIMNQTSVGNNSFIGMNIVINKHIDDNMMVLTNEKVKISGNKNYRRFL